MIFELRGTPTCEDQRGILSLLGRVAETLGRSETSSHHFDKEGYLPNNAAAFGTLKK